MRKMLLAVLMVGSGGIMLLFFGFVILYQVLPPKLQPVISGALIFPAEVPETPLRILQLTEYYGPFLEEPDQTQPMRTAAVLVENKGGLYIAQGAVILERIDAQLVFEIRDLPPGSKALVLEKDAQMALGAMGWSCYGWVREEYPEQPGNIEFRQLNRGLEIINRSDHVMPELWVSYKRFTEGSDTYVGGISFQTVVYDLQPGEKRILPLSHYGKDRIRVVKTVVFYDA